VSQAGADLRDSGIVGDHHPPLTCRQILCGVKRVDRRSESPKRLAIDRRTDSLASILDQDEAARISQSYECFEVAGRAMQMHWHNCPRSWSDHRRCRARIEIERIVYVRKNGTGSGVDNRIRRGDER